MTTSSAPGPEPLSNASTQIVREVLEVLDRRLPSVLHEDPLLPAWLDLRAGLVKSRRDAEQRRE